MDKQLIERIALEEKSRLAMFGMDKVCVDLVTRCLARIDAERGKEVVAWALFSENGNIRIWTSAPEEVRRLAEDQGMTLSPLFLSPTIPEGMALVHNSDCAGLVTKWRRNTEERDDKSGYERGVDFAFCKAADELEKLLAAQGE